LESGDAMMTLFWYRSQLAVQQIKTLMSETQAYGEADLDLAIRSNAEAVWDLMEGGTIRMILVEVDGIRMAELERWLPLLKQCCKEVKWVALMNQAFLKDSTLDKERIAADFDEFVMFETLGVELLWERMLRTRTLYERRADLGLSGITDLSRMKEIERIISEQPDLHTYEAEALMCGIHESQKKKLRFKLGDVFRVAEKSLNFNKARLKICVMGNSGYGCELGWVMSKKFGKRTLILDADRLFPSLDLLLEVKKTVPDQLEGYETTQATGLNVLLDAVRKNSLTMERIMGACSRVKGNEALYALTGSYNLHDYEYYDKDDFIRLIDKIESCFEVVILLVNGFIYDAFTAVSLLISDKNLLPVSGGVLELRSAAASAAYVTERQKLDGRKTHFLAFDVEDSQRLTQEDYEALTGARFLGRIPRNVRRQSANMEGRMYGPLMDKAVIEAHEKLIARLIEEMRC
jgi:cellulose biosynthesis protein BcsQ